MTAKIAGFISRAEAGLRKPRSISHNIKPGDGGCALHYGGPAQKITDHSQCARRWKAWQDYHMDTHGWADIAYTLGVCNHGYVLAGRGAGVRTAANGTNTGNYTHYAICWIGGEGETPTQVALDAFEWATLELRKAGAGKSVKSHSYFKPTGCPGDPLKRHAAALDGKDISTSTPITPSEEDTVQAIVLEPGSNRQWFIDGTSRLHITGAQRTLYMQLGAPYLGEAMTLEDLRRLPDVTVVPS